MINLDDPLHKRRRALVNRGFTPGRVADQEQKLRALTTRLIDDVIERGECEFVRDIARWIPMVAIGDMLGIETEDHEWILEFSDLILGGGEAASIEDDAQRRELQQSQSARYWAYQAGVVEDRRKNPRDDLVSLLIQSDIDGDALPSRQARHVAVLRLRAL